MKIKPPNHAKIKIGNKKITYFENDFRMCDSDETLAKFFSMNNALKIVKHLYEITSDTFRIAPKYVSICGKPPNLKIPELVNQFYPGDDIECYGKGLTKTQCFVSALMEAVERYSSFWTDQELIEASFKDVRDIAIDPESFVLEEKHFKNYTDNLKIKWTWAYSLMREECVLVPAIFAFLIYFNPKESDQCFVDSNGLSCGNCMEEAILHGIFEVTERDALYISHRNRLCMPDVDPTSSKNRYVQEIFQILDRDKITVHIKNTTTDIKIPSFSALLVNETDSVTTYSYAVCAHVDPDLALLRTVTEALQGYEVKGHSDWLDLCTIDHLRQKGKITMKMEDIRDISSQTDLGENVSNVTALFKEMNLDILVINLTRREIGFPVVRVLIPALQPCDNESNPRLSERLFTVPKILGYRPDRATKDELMMGPITGFLTGNRG